MDVSIGIVFGAIAMLSWGASDFFITKSARGTDVIRAFMWSQIIAMAMLSPVFFTFFSLPAVSLSMLVVIIASSFLTVVSNLAFYKSVQVGKVAIVMPVTSCWAVVTVVLSLMFLNEVLSGTQAVGVTMAILGAILVSFRLHDLAKLKNRMKGVGYAVIAALAYGVDFVLIDILVKETGWFFSIFSTTFLSALCLLAYSGAVKRNVSFPRKILLFVVLVAILDSVAYLSYASGLTSEYSAVVAPIGAASPAVSILLASVFFREKLEINQKIGAVSVLASLILLSL